MEQFDALKCPWTRYQTLNAPKAVWVVRRLEICYIRTVHLSFTIFRWVGPSRTTYKLCDRPASHCVKLVPEWGMSFLLSVTHNVTCCDITALSGNGSDSSLPPPPPPFTGKTPHPINGAMCLTVLLFLWISHINMKDQTNTIHSRTCSLNS